MGGLHRMVAADTYRIDVLTQVAAPTKALQGVSVGLLDEHLRHCVAGAWRAESARQTGWVPKASPAIERLVKS